MSADDSQILTNVNTLLGASPTLQWTEGRDVRHKPKAQHGALVSDSLEFSADWTRTAGKAIAAMDTFAGEAGSRQRSLKCALLSKFAHPNDRGLIGFHASAELQGEGWTIRYHLREDFNARTGAAVLGTLFDNMRIGYAASELLRTMQVSLEKGRVS